MIKRPLLTAVSLAVAAASLVVASPQAHAVSNQSHTARDRKDPSSDSTPSQAFLRACHDVGTSRSDQQQCANAAMSSFDAARDKEGMGPMSLPSNWATMSPTVQLLTIVDIERVDRGETPALGLSPALNKYAKKGADEDTDPPFPKNPHGTFETSVWAGVGTSVLLADFIWMYDDGAGSVNVDCEKNGVGCWGHRHNVIHAYGAPMKIGAAWKTDPNFDGSMAVEFVGGDKHDKVSNPTWATITKKFLPGVSPSTITATGTSPQQVLVWASGANMQVTLKISSGASSWSVNRSSCSLQAGHDCKATVTYSPGGGSPTGTLLVTGPGGSQHVALRV